MLQMAEGEAVYGILFLVGGLGFALTAIIALKLYRDDTKSLTRLLITIVSINLAIGFLWRGVADLMGLVEAEMVSDIMAYGSAVMILATALVIGIEYKLKETMENIRLQNEIMKNLAEGIYLIRISDLKIVWANPRFEEMFGYNPGEMIGKLATIVNAPTDKSPDEIAEEIMSVLERTGEWHGEVNNIKKDGTQFWCHANVSVFKHPVYGEVLISVHSDITEAKKVEKAIREAENARSEKLTMLGQLAGGVGHELRNPLGAIKNASYFLNMVLKEPEPEVKGTLEILDKEIKTSEMIINSLLGFARPKLPLLQRVDINNLIQEVVSGTTVPQNIEITKDLNMSLPIVLADPSQLTLVFRNIILNAIQAMIEGGKIRIKTSVPNPDVISITIQDTGIGISQENLRKLFEPLFTTKAKGIGFGLAISKLIVESHGGIIKALSEEGKSSTFTIEIPIKGKKAF